MWTKVVNCRVGGQPFHWNSFDRAQLWSVLFCFYFALFYYVYEYFACLDVHASSVCSACGGQRKVLNTLGLELKMVGSCHLGSLNWSWVFWKSNQWSQLMSHLSSHNYLILKIFAVSTYIYFIVFAVLKFNIALISKVLILIFPLI